MTRIAPITLHATAIYFLRVGPWRRRVFSIIAVALAGCGSIPKAPVYSTGASSGNQANAGPSSSSNSVSHLPILPAAGSGRGGYYQNDGPGDAPPDGLLNLPDIIPKIEPYSLTGNKPYVVFGKTYTPMVDLQPYKQRGIGSWYGKKFHGHKTSSGEPYDMYKLTAAHPTLPIPSYARVTNLSNGVQIIVRINDRGPFHSSRIIDLSYSAALKLGYLGKGSSELEVERLLPEDIARIAGAKQPPPQPASAVVTTAPVVAPIVSPIIAPIIAPPPSHPEPVVVTMEAPSILNLTPPVTAMPSITAPLNVINAREGAINSVASDGSGAVGGYYVQFGAFTEIGNAEAVRARLMQAWDSSLPPLEVTFVGVFYRLHSGPFSTRSEAVLAGQKAQAVSEIKPMVVQR
jgi:rare lipoprotein A